MESVRNVYLQGKVCRVATGSNLSTLLEPNKLAFERMLQEELSVKVVVKSSLCGPHVFLAVFHLLANNYTSKI